MKELLLHYVWKHKLFTGNDLITTENERIEIIDVGKHNTDGGPDFFNAKIKIGETLWAGNVEIHTHSSDWIKHHHHTDKKYNSIILHVVDKADVEIHRLDGAKIPQFELKYPVQIDHNYEHLLSEEKWVACESKIANVPNIFIQNWKNALLTERLGQKSSSIQLLLTDNQQDWEEAFYVTLARNFGFGTNSQAFESLAKSLPLSILAKHKNNIFQIEALLLGQSGLLSPDFKDDYACLLKKEYDFLASKYKLQAIGGTQWQKMRLRPDNFPYIRIAQFAALINISIKLFSKIVENIDIIHLRKIFDCQPSDYWQTHYIFDKISPFKNKKLGEQSIDNILINTVIPFLFCNADLREDETLKEKALFLLDQIPAERNNIISGWTHLGINSKTAFDSQALIQLKKIYCDERNCLRCRIGHKVLTN